jgi:hypothetical protein
MNIFAAVLPGLLFFLSSTLNAQKDDSVPEIDNFPVLEGHYLGLKAPLDTASVFAPGIISTGMNEHSHPVFSKDLKEIFWSVFPIGVDDNQLMMRMVEINSKWQKPEIVEFSTKYSEGNPFYSLDGKRVYFQSERPLPKVQEKKDWNIWYIEKREDQWSSKPNLYSFYPNTYENYDNFVCIINDGSFYLTRNNFDNDVPQKFGIVKVPYSNGKFAEPLILGPNINSKYLDWTPYVDPEETYMIFSSNRDDPGSVLGCDLFISFRKEGRWQKPKKFGAEVNSDTIERFPYVSPDGKYLFFIRGFGDIFWIDAAIIDKMR